jgi:hypothetical protein
MVPEPSAKWPHSDETGNDLGVQAEVRDAELLRHQSWMAAPHG